MTNGNRREWGFSFTPRPLFAPGKGPALNVQEAGWASGPVWTGAENFAPTGIRSPDRPDRSQSLYRLRYPAHVFKVTAVQYTTNVQPSKCLYFWCITIVILILTHCFVLIDNTFFFLLLRCDPTRVMVSSFDAPQLVGLLWTSDQLVAETSTWQHTTLTTDKYPCPRRGSNPRSQQASGRRPTP